MKGWVGLVGWPTADGLPIEMVTHQLQVRCRPVKVRHMRVTWRCSQGCNHSCKVEVGCTMYDVHSTRDRVKEKIWRTSSSIISMMVSYTSVTDRVLENDFWKLILKSIHLPVLCVWIDSISWRVEIYCWSWKRPIYLSQSQWWLRPGTSRWCIWVAMSRVVHHSSRYVWCMWFC